MEVIWICYVGIGIEELIVSRSQLLGVLVFTLVHTVSALLLGICCVGQWVRNESQRKGSFQECRNAVSTTERYIPACSTLCISTIAAEPTGILSQKIN